MASSVSRLGGGVFNTSASGSDSESIDQQPMRSSTSVEEEFPQPSSSIEQIEFDQYWQIKGPTSSALEISIKKNFVETKKTFTRGFDEFSPIYAISPREIVESFFNTPNHQNFIFPNSNFFIPAKCPSKDRASSCTQLIKHLEETRSGAAAAPSVCLDQAEVLLGKSSHNRLKDLLMSIDDLPALLSDDALMKSKQLPKRFRRAVEKNREAYFEVAKSPVPALSLFYHFCKEAAVQSHIKKIPSFSLLQALSTPAFEIGRDSIKKQFSQLFVGKPELPCLKEADQPIKYEIEIQDTAFSALHVHPFFFMSGDKPIGLVDVRWRVLGDLNGPDQFRAMLEFGEPVFFTTANSGHFQLILELLTS